MILLSALIKIKSFILAGSNYMGV